MKKAKAGIKPFQKSKEGKAESKHINLKKVQLKGSRNSAEVIPAEEGKGSGFQQMSRC